MKKYYLLIGFLSLLFMVSCSNDDLVNKISNDDPQPVELSEKAEKAISLLNDFRKFINQDSSNVKTLKVSQSVNVLKVKNCLVDLSKEGVSLSLTKSGNEKQIIEIYTLDFEDNGKKGFSIICPDERIERIYAFTPDGDLNDTIYNLGLKMALNDINAICKEDLLNYYLDSISPKTKASRPVGKYTTGNRLPIAWNQDAPYNQQCKTGCSDNDSYRGRVAAGCGAISVAQALMYYAKFGVYSNPMKRLDINYNTLAAQEKITMSSPLALRNEVAKFVFDVAELHKSVYGCINAGGTTTYLLAAAPVFENYAGWTLQRVEGNTTYYGQLKFVEGSLDACRVYGTFTSGNIMLSRGSGSAGGHVWVYSGMNYQMYKDNQQMKSVDQLYANWGWGGKSNGYYAFSSSGGNFPNLRQHMYIEPKGNFGCSGFGGGGIFQ